MSDSQSSTQASLAREENSPTQKTLDTNTRNSAKSSFYIKFLWVSNIILLLICLCLGGLFVYSNFRPFPTYQNLQSLINREFLYDTPTQEKYQEGIYKGIVDSLNDPYSEYLPKKDRQNFVNDLNRRYKGIGVVFDFRDKDRIKVSNILPNSPALRAGVKSGDILLQIDEQSVNGLTSEEVVNKIRGQEGTKVKLQFLTDEGVVTREITRAEISVELITLEVKGDAAVITIVSFGEGLDAKMRDITQRIVDDTSIKRVIVDVRNNPGGLLNEAVDVISYFLPDNTEIVQEKTKDTTERLYSQLTTPTLKDYPVSVVIDSTSASASEILAGALKDQRGAELIGSKTYGKGVVQKIFDLANGDSIKLTVAEWLTPKGEAINKQGLKPTVEVKQGEDALQAALGRK